MLTGASVENMPTAPFLESSHLLEDPQGLRARAQEHGYLFFKGLLPEELVLDLRRRFLAIIERYGWLSSAHELMEGVVNLEVYNKIDPQRTQFCGVGVTPEIYQEVQRVRQFHELAHHPNLISVYEKLFGDRVFPHPRNIARIMISGEGDHPTPPHQDFIHVQGTSNVWTAWFPLGSCPRAMGALTVLDGSHRKGVLAYHEAQGAGGLEAYLCDPELVWAEGDFKAGDVLTFHSQTVHRALPNEFAERARLSCDYRYQPVAEEVNDRSLNVHCDVLTWEQVYEGWPDGGIQWYWKNNELKMSPWDDDLRWQKDKIC